MMGDKERGTALVTGASAGLGSEFARLFAADGCDVVLVARRVDRLESLAAELSAAHGVETHCIAMDLGQAGAGTRLHARLVESGLEIDYLVNNAGFGLARRFADGPVDRQLEMVQVNVTSLVELTGLLVPGMVARGRGRILNVGSTAGFQPGPFMAIYYASKAFVNSFSEALAYELAGSGVTCTVSCPGATATEFAGQAGTADSLLFRLGAADAATVAREAYRAMRSGRRMVVHGWTNRLGVLAAGVSPRAALLSIAARLNQR